MGGVMRTQDAQLERAATAAEARRFFRILTTANALLEETHVSTLDDSGRRRLIQLSDQLLLDAENVLPRPLSGELEAFAAVLDQDVTTGQLRVALAELVGWLRGVLVSTPLMAPEHDAAPMTTKEGGR